MLKEKAAFWRKEEHGLPLFFVISALPRSPCQDPRVRTILIRKGSQKAVALPGCAYRGEPRTLVPLPASAPPASESRIGGYSLWLSGVGVASGGHDAQARPGRRHPAR